MSEKIIEGKAYYCYLNQPDIRSNPDPPREKASVIFECENNPALIAPNS